MADYDNPRPSSQPIGSTDQAVAKDNLITLDLMATLPAGSEILNRKGDSVAPFSDVSGSVEAAAQSAIEAAQSAIEAEQSAEDASTTANFLGNWTDLTGAQVKGVVAHEGERWQLLIDVADITLTEPSTSNADYLVIFSSLASISRAFSVLGSQVIYSSDATTALDDVFYIYDSINQTTWSVPTLDSNGKTIVSVSITGALVTIGGTGSNSYQLTTVNKSGVEFETLADVDAGRSIGAKVSLIVGDSIRVLDYATGNNSGVLFFKVVAAATGVDDGGKFINLPTLGLQLQQNLKEPYDAKAWGAVGVGGDDGDSLYNCLQASGKAQKAMHIPAGHYVSNRNVAYDDIAGGSIVITGAGESLTKISFETIETGFRFGAANLVDSVEMKGMEITTNAQSISFAAIYANHVPGKRPCSNFENLFIHGVDGSGDIYTGNWFQRGLLLNNAQQPTIHSCKFMGAFATTATEAARAEAAIYLTADTGATIPRITGCWSLNYSSGLKIRNNHQDARVEGIYISDCDWVFVNKGVDIVFNQFPAYHAPQVTINNMHTEAFQECIHIEGCAEVKISDTLLYAYNSAEPTNLINLVDCNDVKVYDNHLIGRPANTVNLEGVRALNCNLVQVYDNEISTNGAHIVSTGTTQNMSELGNTFKGSGLRTADTSPSAITNKMGYTLALGSNSNYSYYNSEGFLVQGGSIAVTTDGSGLATVFFPRGFNQQLLSVRFCNGDFNLTSIGYSLWSKSATFFKVVALNHLNLPIRIDWEVTGI